ncbi:MAG: hypothetical protein ACRDT4_13720 [Micromonosporaceae bacterium]
MMAIIAAVLFGIALLLTLAGRSLGTPLLAPGTLTTAGLLFVALHLAGVGGAWRGRRWGRRT